MSSVDHSVIAPSALMANALALAEKREALCRKATPCPSCNTQQVQLVSWVDEIKWKCRHCRHQWSGAQQGAGNESEL